MSIFKRRRRRVLEYHRSTAANCRYWTGDRSPVDFGTCTLCPPEQGAKA